MCDVQCPSCPFLPLNFKEFNAVVAKLCQKHGLPKPDFWAGVDARRKVTADALAAGSLNCHQAYDENMNIDPSKARPCAGLAKALAAREATA